MAERKSKVVPLTEALSGIKDGAKIMAAGAHYNNIPMALVRELVRRGVKNLEIIPTPSAGLWVDTLIGAGLVAKVHVSYIGMEFLGLAPNFRRAAEAKTITIEEKDEPTIFHGLRAAGSGLPFVALPPLQKMTDLMKANPTAFKEIADPFTGKPAIAIAPLSPDVALIHFAKCDRFGNGVSIGGRHMEDIIAKAAKRVIVSAEEIVPDEEITASPTRTTLPGVLVDAVVHAPWGCYPGTCPGVYAYDRAHLEQYYEYARKGKTQEYLERYVLGQKDDAALLGAASKDHLAGLRIG